jgi:hypothetical protein
VKVYSDGNQRAITSPVLSHPWDYSIWDDNINHIWFHYK